MAEICSIVANGLNMRLTFVTHRWLCPCFQGTSGIAYFLGNPVGGSADAPIAGHGQCNIHKLIHRSVGSIKIGGAEAGEKSQPTVK
jgi:hypothetical protein